MKTFREFITEVYDPDVVGKSQIRKQGEGGRVGRMRKQTEPEKKRMKAVGGGKMVQPKLIRQEKILEHNVKHQIANNNLLKREVQQEKNKWQLLEQREKEQLKQELVRLLSYHHRQHLNQNQKHKH